MKKRHQVRPRAKSRQPLRLAGINYRENIPNRIFEPGDGGTISAHDPFLVSLDVRQIINLKTHGALSEFIDRLIHIANRKIKDSVAWPEYDSASDK